MAQILSQMDVANLSNPKLDNLINFSAPDDPANRTLFLTSEGATPADQPYLETLFRNRPEGTLDADPGRQTNARLYHAAMRRKLYFEGDESKLKTRGLPIWKDLLPYRRFDRFMQFIATGNDPDAKLRNQLTLGISKSERIYNETVGRESLCLVGQRPTSRLKSLLRLRRFRLPRCRGGHQQTGGFPRVSSQLHLLPPSRQSSVSSCSRANLTLSSSNTSLAIP